MKMEKSKKPYEKPTLVKLGGINEVVRVGGAGQYESGGHQPMNTCT